MTTLHTARLAAALFAALLADTAPAQTGHHHHDSAPSHELGLDHGRKWSTDTTLRSAMQRIHNLVDAQLGASHAGKSSAAQLRASAGKIDAEIAAIVADCKLEPRADAMLHLVIADLIEGAGAMAGQDTKLTPEQGLARTAKAVNDYGHHFDHPGFRPLHTGH